MASNIDTRKIIWIQYPGASSMVSLRATNKLYIYHSSQSNKKHKYAQQFTSLESAISGPTMDRRVLGCFRLLCRLSSLNVKWLFQQHYGWSASVTLPLNLVTVIVHFYLLLHTCQPSGRFIYSDEWFHNLTSTKWELGISVPASCSFM